MDLRETVDGMLSDDYKKRFIAEYRQTAIRYSRLVDMLAAWDDNRLDFTPACPKKLLIRQMKTMLDYLTVLEKRADIENIDLINEVI